MLETKCMLFGAHLVLHSLFSSQSFLIFAWNESPPMKCSLNDLSCLSFLGQFLCNEQHCCILLFKVRQIIELQIIYHKMCICFLFHFYGVYYNLVTSKQRMKASSVSSTKGKFNCSTWLIKSFIWSACRFRFPSSSRCFLEKIAF